MPNPLSRWIIDKPRSSNAGRVRTAQQSDLNLKFKQLVERWVEFKRLHLGFVQTLNSLLNGNSSPINLIKQSMLCAHEIRELRAYGHQAQPEQRLDLDTLPRRLPLDDYENLYSVINSGQLDDQSLESLIDKNNIHVAESILKVTGDPIARLDNYFIALAEQEKFDSLDRISKWTQEITVLHKTIISLYMMELREKGAL